jgi:PAS domain S-box-containing protein
MKIVEQEYERRFREIIESAGLIVVQLDHHGNIIYCNDFTCRTLEWKKEELLGRNWFETCLPKNICAEVKKAFFNIMETGGEAHRNYTNQVVTKSGDEKMIRWNNIALKNMEGRLIGTSSIGEDVSDLTRANDQLAKLNRIYAVMSEVDHSIVKIRDRDEFFREICRIIVEVGGFRMAWMGLVDDAGLNIQPFVHEGYVDGYLNHVGSIADKRPGKRGIISEAINQKKTVVCNNIATDPRMEESWDEASKRGYRSSACIPVMFGEKVYGVLCFYSNEVGFFSWAEVHLLNQIAADVAFALEIIHKEEMRNEAEIKLKEKVKELERLNEIMMDREERIIELKEELKRSKK